MTVPQLLPWLRADTRAGVRGQSGMGTLRLPLPTPARVAVVGARFRLRNGEHSFEEGNLEGLRSYEPEVLVLPLDLALSFAARQQAKTLDLPSVSVALIVLTSVAGGPISQEDRDQLWSVFGLPVFEQLLGHDGTVAARECEVHDGLHFESGAFDLNATELIAAGSSTGLAGEIVTAICDCGLETPRLQNLSRLKNRAAVAAA